MAMNNPQSDGNESVIDIFVLGQSETGTQELIEQLENQDYQVTLFSDGPQLIDTLRSGKPNLIICDSTSFGQEAYEYCRQIKSDDNLWMIPVMILTRASNLGDLLHVLDCNADNFIAEPYDSPYLLSLIEGMLLTPVQQQTMDQIKTQFKIQHEDQVFVVTADRRKLLEFLMSAFEIAVKNSEDLASANAEIQRLSSRLTILEDAGIENSRIIETLSATVKKKEQDERTLKGDLEETEQALDEKTAEAGQLSRDLGDARTLLATAEEHIRIHLAEKEKSDLSSQSEISRLTGQVSSLSQDICAKTTELDAAQQALADEAARSARLVLAVKESEAQSEQLKTSLQTLTLEHEQQAAAFASEKDRAGAAEQEVKSVLQAKAQSEQDLTHQIDELKNSVRQLNDEILRLKSVLEAETGRCTAAEMRQETLRHEMEQSEATHELHEESQKRQLDELQGRVDTAVATIFSQERELKILKDELVIAHAEERKTAAAAAAVTASFNETRVEVEEREWKIQSLEKQIADAGILKEASDEKVRALTASLESVQSALNAEKEQHAALQTRLNAAIRERDETLQSVRGAHDQVKTDLDVHKNDLLRLNRDLEAAALLRQTLQGDIASASSRIKDLEHELKSAVQAKEQTGQQARSLSEDLEGIKAALKEARVALADEKKQRDVVEARLNAAIRERDETLQSVRGAHSQTRTDLEVHRNDLLRLNRDLEAATQLNSTLLADFNAASARIDGLEHELHSVVQGKEQTGQQARSLSEDLEGTKAELETERRIRRTAEVNLQKSAQVASRLEGDIARAIAEREQLKSSLEQERNLHAAAEEKVRAVTLAKEQVEHELDSVKVDHEQIEDQRAAKIQELKMDFEQVLARQRDLEQKVRTLESQKAEADAKVEALSDEIQQARTALADEWEDHMNDEERLAASQKKTVQIEQSLSRTSMAAPEPERKWAVVVSQTRLPTEIRPVPKAVAVTAPPATHEGQVPTRTLNTPPEGSPSFGIEDLFEDEAPGPAVADRISGVSGQTVPAPEADTHDIIMDDTPAHEPEAADVQETDEDEDAGEETDGELKTSDDFGTSPSSYGISFNRQQWLDLLKWSHHSGALSQEQRMQIIRMGRLVQRGRKLTRKQDEQVREMIVLVQTLGYKFH